MYQTVFNAFDKVDVLNNSMQNLGKKNPSINFEGFKLI